MTHIITARPLYLVDHAIAQATVTAALLQCPYCHEWYPLRPEPVALEIDGDVATVRPGFVEICPCCQSESYAGQWLLIGQEKEEAPAG